MKRAKKEKKEGDAKIGELEETLASAYEEIDFVVEVKRPHFAQYTSHSTHHIAHRNSTQHTSHYNV
jgi:hypothetical protein